MPAENAPPAVMPPAVMPPAAAAVAPATPAPAAAPPVVLAAAPAPALGARAEPELGDPELLEQQDRADRVDRGERLVGLAQLDLEGAAAVAGLEVATQRRRRARDPLGHLPELEPHLAAGEQARLGCLGQSHARAHEQRLDARHRRLHRLGDLVVRERVDLAQQQGGALRLGQLLHVGDDLPELLAAVDGVGGAEAAVALEDVHRVLTRRLGTAEVVEAAVARDPVEPGTRVDRPVVRADRAERRGEHLLQDVLGVLGRAEHVATEREQARLIALDKRFEGAVVTAPDQGDQPLVALKTEQRRSSSQRGKARGVLKSRSFQVGLPAPATP